MLFVLVVCVKKDEVDVPVVTLVTVVEAALEQPPLHLPPQPM